LRLCSLASWIGLCTLSLHDALPISGKRLAKPESSPLFPIHIGTQKHDLNAVDATGLGIVEEMANLLEQLTLIVLRHCRCSLSTTDRKSTRLNSSHDQTSYAVFRLKK